jgi:hypothetical protein
MYKRYIFLTNELANLLNQKAKEYRQNISFAPNEEMEMNFFIQYLFQFHIIYENQCFYSSIK